MSSQEKETELSLVCSFTPPDAHDGQGGAGQKLELRTQSGCSEWVAGAHPFEPLLAVSQVRVSRKLELGVAWVSDADTRR